MASSSLGSDVSKAPRTAPSGSQLHVHLVHEAHLPQRTTQGTQSSQSTQSSRGEANGINLCAVQSQHHCSKGAEADDNRKRVASHSNKILGVRMSKSLSTVHHSKLRTEADSGRPSNRSKNSSWEQPHQEMRMRHQQGARWSRCAWPHQLFKMPLRSLRAAKPKAQSSSKPFKVPSRVQHAPSRMPPRSLRAKVGLIQRHLVELPPTQPPEPPALTWSEAQQNSRPHSTQTSNTAMG
jgi:hypothetical protein